MANKILAVWGGPSCGKTAVSVKLALALAEKKQNVVLVLCDSTAPPLPLILSPNDIESEKSLGALLETPVLSKESIFENSITLKKQAHIVLLGMLKGENVNSYSAFSKERAYLLYRQLKELDAAVIIDCTSDILSDFLSFAALGTADQVLRLISCDLKSISFFSSQLPILENNQLHPENHIKVASNVKDLQAEEHVAAVFQGVSCSLPYCPEIEQQYLDGSLFQELRSHAGRKYTKTIEKLAGDLFE